MLDLRNHNRSLTSRCCFHIISLIPRKSAPFRQSRLLFNSSLPFPCNHPNQSKWQMSDTDRDCLDRVLFREMGAITWKPSAWDDHGDLVLALKTRVKDYLLFCLRTQLALRGRYLPWDPENAEGIHCFFSWQTSFKGEGNEEKKRNTISPFHHLLQVSLHHPVHQSLPKFIRN